MRTVSLTLHLGVATALTLPLLTVEIAAGQGSRTLRPLQKSLKQPPSPLNNRFPLAATGQSSLGQFPVIQPLGTALPGQTLGGQFVGNQF
ncbi:MAG: hypothetical protein L0Z62_27200, partial [Gemmataceae bacterium]|nr:hypothetical protein [Gemmataceae bacterium]